MKIRLSMQKIIELFSNCVYDYDECMYIYQFQMQQYLIMSKMVPYILKLESTIDKFVSSTALLPKSQLISSDLNAFSFVSKLLTGELMGNEIINPYYVLAENITKKPVFIIKSNKRKVNVPVLSTIKLFKSVT